MMLQHFTSCKRNYLINAKLIHVRDFRWIFSAKSALVHLHDLSQKRSYKKRPTVYHGSKPKRLTTPQQKQKRRDRTKPFKFDAKVTSLKPKVLDNNSRNEYTLGFQNSTDSTESRQRRPPAVSVRKHLSNPRKSYAPRASSVNLAENVKVKTGSLVSNKSVAHPLFSNISSMRGLRSKILPCKASLNT